ncbi:MAG: RNA polymerase sigma factor [Verrucomicrobiaceae bacterium]|nr:RNA polymerase sigma factor [Verrucomicrobiaceae bacterium]
MANELDVASLVAAALQGDDDAARSLVRHLYPFVAKLVRAHRPKRAAEEDLCQMIFIKMFQNLKSYSGAVPLQHWLSRIAINTCLNQIAAEKARPELRRADLSEEQEAVIDHLAATSDELAPGQQLAARDLVAHLLDALKPAERVVINLMYLEQKSVDEIRKLTGWSAALVKVRAFRARKKLKERLARLKRKENDGD